MEAFYRFKNGIVPPGSGRVFDQFPPLEGTRDPSGSRRHGYNVKNIFALLELDM